MITKSGFSLGPIMCQVKPVEWQKEHFVKVGITAVQLHIASTVQGKKVWFGGGGAMEHEHSSDTMSSSASSVILANYL